MSARLVLTLIIGFTATVRASDKSVEVTLEDTEPTQNYLRWKIPPQKQKGDSDSNYVQWQYKFHAGSNKRLGTMADVAAIKTAVASTKAPTIRWVSRFVVVVAADCYSDVPSSGRLSCLYVLEKHGSKWKVTHYYLHRLLTLGLTNRSANRSLALRIDVDLD